MRTYKINSNSGSLGFLTPPGHYNHTHSLDEYSSPRGRTVVGTYSLDHIDDEHADASEHITRAVNKIREESRKNWVCSEAWIRNVYGYFRDSYAPESGTRNVSEAVNHNPAAIAAGAARKVLAEAFETPGKLYTVEIRPLPWLKQGGQGEADANSYRDGSAKAMRGARRGYEVTAKADGSRVYVYALADDGARYGALPILQHYADALTEAGFTNVEIEEPRDTPTGFVPERVTADNPVPVERIDPARHLAVMCIREYFPDHEPRTDLIENPGKGYGAYSCAKCGQKVQYEAKLDAHCAVTTRVDGTGMTHWTYGTECPKGGSHTVED
ncbi:hypothetical protein E6R60_26585 [Streptomyces sp. A0642]|uniref:hypothetical protein n=1 Tax=Streptomyces sp. A0642 TaxID=2563100 RepID=UPI0010A1FFF2|nr:hypothetical protein [Streptomyces sp. A0642]THA72500.1 hypothetical protein E6R60_26585 [Streptomyces sp. A0642]